MSKFETIDDIRDNLMKIEYDHNKSLSKDLDKAYSRMWIEEVIIIILVMVLIHIIF